MAVTPSVSVLKTVSAFTSSSPGFEESANFFTSSMRSLLPPPADQAIPANIISDLNDQPFNAAPSDIRPEDAKFATTRALTPIAQGGLGYGPGPVGISVLSAFSSKSAQVVDFNISGTDPITGKPVRAFSTENVGAQVVLTVVNATDTAPGHLGNTAFNNVDRFVLAKVFDGTLSRTRDLVPSSGI